MGKTYAVVQGSNSPSGGRSGVSSFHAGLRDLLLFLLLSSGGGGRGEGGALYPSQGGKKNPKKQHWFMRLLFPHQKNSDMVRVVDKEEVLLIYCCHPRVRGQQERRWGGESPDLSLLRAIPATRRMRREFTDIRGHRPPGLFCSSSW